MYQLYCFNFFISSLLLILLDSTILDIALLYVHLSNLLLSKYLYVSVGYLITYRY